MENDVKIYVDDQIYSGWQSVEITRNVGSISGQFVVSLMDKWRDTFSSWPIVPGKPVKVSIDNDRVLTGYIDELSTAFSPSDRSISISGRDKAGDLVDCSAKPGELIGLKADAIARKLIEPFGMQLKVYTDVGAKFPKWSIKAGETVFENLERLGKQRGLFFMSDNFGVLMIQKRSEKKSTSLLRQGQNIISASAKYDDANRFSTYEIIGQSSGTDKSFGDEAIKANAQATDKGVDRYRPMLIIGEGNTNQKSAIERSKWELATRIAKALVITVNLYGWRQSDSSLWEPNVLVDLDCPFLGINSEMLISSVKFRKDKTEGTTTQIELVRKESFLPEPEVLKKNDPVEGMGW